LKHVPELARLRLSSIDSVETDRDLLDAFASDARLMPHLHLSLQADLGFILKGMKGRQPGAANTPSILAPQRMAADAGRCPVTLAGCPSETSDLLAFSRELVDACGLTHLNVLPLSPRPGTPAARMPQVRREVINDRARRLREKAEAALRRHLEAQVGRKHRVL